MQLAAVLNKQWHAGNRHLTPSRITALSLEMHKNQPFRNDSLDGDGDLFGLVGP
jgi:hypothetical protein